MASNKTEPDSPSVNQPPVQEGREEPEGSVGGAATGPPPDLTSDTPPDVLDGTTAADARGSGVYIN